MTSCGGRGRWGRLAERLVLAAFLVFVWLGFGLRVRAWVAVLAWPGLARLGLVWPGLAWSGPAWLGLARLGLAGAGAPAGAAWPRGVLPAPRRLRGPATRDCPRSLRNQRAPPGSGCPATARAPSRRSGNPLFLVRSALHRRGAGSTPLGHAAPGSCHPLGNATPGAPPLGQPLGNATAGPRHPWAGNPSVSECPLTLAGIPPLPLAGEGRGEGAKKCAQSIFPPAPLNFPSTPPCAVGLRSFFIAKGPGDYSK